MTRTTLFVGALAIVVSFQVRPTLAQDQLSGVAGEATPLQARNAESLPPDLKKALDSWENYIHYLRVANLELANAAGNAFLGMNLTSEQLLKVVEDISTYQDYDLTLTRAEKLSGAAGELAAKVSKKIRDARLDLARNSDRIHQAILQLDGGLRGRINATERLKHAGEYAAPQMLQVLLGTTDEDRQLRPFVIETMVSIGRPMVSPLCTALHDLPAVPKQEVVEVLTRIGYPLALPYFKAELTRNDLSDETRKALETGYGRIIQHTGIPADSSADRLFLMLGEDYYRGRQDLIISPKSDINLLWKYDSGSGLSFLEIPTPIFGDVMAMQASRRALQLNKNLSAALSLWLAANFRRENNLPQGKTDPSYGPKMHSPQFYATLAGPSHLQPVLQRALGDGDAALALDAIHALDATSGTYNLINLHGTMQPLIAAMNYPDRRVRFEAAFAIARSMPHVEFGGASRVVPVLAEAIRESAKPYAVAIAPDTATLNKVTTLVQGVDKSYQVMIGNSVDVAAAQVSSAPGVDLVVIDLPSMDQAMAAVTQVRQMSKMLSTPIVVLVGSNEVITATHAMADKPLVTVADRGAKKEQIDTAIKQAAAEAAGAKLSDKQALDYATTALDILKMLTVSNSAVFNPSDAMPAVKQALSDKRQPVVLGAAEAMAMLPGAEAQMALADAALDAGDPGMQVKLLQSLAQSARLNGSKLSDHQLKKLLALVDSSTGPVADAAAEAHGALNLPTSNAVGFITSEK